MKIELFGYSLSVYSRIPRLVLHEKGVDADWIECDPFNPEAGTQPTPHPMGRVPVPRHGTFTLYETGAISRYLDSLYPNPPLQPDMLQDRARCDQILFFIDAYLYWPLVRQAFLHGYFRPLIGETADRSELDAGMAAASKALPALEALAEGVREGGGTFLVGESLTLADLHLAPMIDYFALVEEGAALLRTYPCLSRWWERMRDRDSVVATRPDFARIKSPGAITSGLRSSGLIG